MMTRSLDYRSDALTEPTPEMWQAMMRHHCGWTLGDEDPAVREIEHEVASLTSLPSGLYFPSGTMANTAALLAQTRAGDRIVADATSHILCCTANAVSHLCALGTVAIPRLGEAGGAASLRDALDFAPLGHPPGITLLCLENSHNYSGGTVLSTADLTAIASPARRAGLALHLDGARIFNAAAALGREVRDLTSDFDTVTVNLDKALSAPGGAVLCGAKEVIARAKIARSRLGAGSLANAGYWAAAARVGLPHALAIARQDNERAAALSQRLADLPGVTVSPTTVSNIVRLVVSPELGGASALTRILRRSQVETHLYSSSAIRFVTHRHITDHSVDQTAVAVEHAVGLLSAMPLSGREPPDAGLPCAQTPTATRRHN